MKSQRSMHSSATRRTLALLALLSILNPQLSTCLAQGTAFTYQGLLNDNGAPANGSYDLTFRIFDAATLGTPLAGPVTNSATAVYNGLFAVTLDFGAGLFTGAGRWLEIAVRTNGTGAFTNLTPRLAITAVPYALTASNLSGTLPTTKLTGTLVSNQLGGTYSSAVIFSNAANSFRGSFTGNGGGLTNVNASTFDGLASSSFWKLDGNNVSPGQVLGTTNNQALEFVVNGFTALRLEPNAMASPNLIGGRNNTIATGVFSATIGGGFANGIQTNANDAVIAGGSFNDIGPGSINAAIGGGVNNKIQTNSSFCTIAGGEAQIIGNNSVHSFIGGGLQNNIQTSTTFSTIGGGNTNSILTGASYANIGGGTKNTLGAATAAAIAGGEANSIQAGADRSAIGGGSQNSTTGANGTVPGGFGNTAASYAFAAGRRAKANHLGSFVWADTTDADFASTGGNQFLIRASGGVGIGTTSPQTRLHVLSPGVQLRLEDATYNNYWSIYTEALGSPTSSGNLLFLAKSGNFVYFDTAGVVHGASDMRLKRDIAPLGAVLDRVLQLRPVSYHMRNASDKAPLTLGFIAQEVEPFFPEVVGEHEGMKSLAYSELVPITVRAIQELNQKVTVTSQKSEDRIQMLEEENLELKTRLEKLEQLLNAKNGGAE